MKNKTPDISIPGLMPHECAMLDKIWSCNSATDLEEYFGTLPAREEAQARMLFQLLLYELVDAEMDDDYSLAKGHLDRIFSK